MIKEALLVGWDMIGWLSYVTGILSAPLVLIKPPMLAFPSPFCTPTTLARTQSEEHVLDRKIEYVVDL